MTELRFRLFPHENLWAMTPEDAPGGSLCKDGTHNDGGREAAGGSRMVDFVGFGS